jgi:hypothetical protein
MSEGRQFEWDEQKRVTTLAKHGIDFVDAVRVFYSSPLIVQSSIGAEQRWLAIGTLDGVAITVVFTMRGSVTRLVTVRKARRNERKRYKDHAGDA